MPKFQLKTLITLLGASVISNSAFSAAFQLYELGTPIIGTADVGQATVGDASTSYFNPAGMSRLDNTQYMLGSQVVLPYVNFAQNTRTTIKGDNGGNAGMLTPGLDLFYVYNVNPKVKLGMNLTSPYAGSLNYDDGWVGRFVVQNVTFYTLALNPSLAYLINDWVSIGVGGTVEYMNLQQTVALPLPASPLVDGQANTKMDSFAPGFNLGILFNPTQTTKVGVTYRSQIIHHLHGTTTFLRIPNQPGTTSRMVMPQNMIASISQELPHDVTLLGEVGYAKWSAMNDIPVNIAGYTAVTVLNWNNTYRVGVGAQYKATPTVTIQAGGSYDSSPTNSSHRIPVLPMDRQIRIGAGVMYALVKAVNLGFSYEYANLGNANINNISSNGTLSGSYSRNYTNFFQASINVTA